MWHQLFAISHLPSAMSTRRLLVVVLAAGLAATAVGVAQTPKPEKDWASHGYDAGAQRYSPLKQINTANVSNLQLAWSYDTPARRPACADRGGGAAGDGEEARCAGPRQGGCACRGASAARAETVGVDAARGRRRACIWLTAYNRVVALDADTGKEIWVKDIGNTPSTRGLAYWPGHRHDSALRSSSARRIRRRC